MEQMCPRAAQHCGTESHCLSQGTPRAISPTVFQWVTCQELQALSRNRAAASSNPNSCAVHHLLPFWGGSSGQLCHYAENVRAENEAD